MTVKQFIENFEIKNIKTVTGWLDKNLIPGAVQINGEWNIPERAWPPYTGARAKNAKSVYTSIVKGISKRKYVSALIYKMSSVEFNGYIAQLEQAGLITVEKENNIPYYQLTLDGIRAVDKWPIIEKALATVVEAASKGAMEAVLEKPEI